MKQFDLFDVVMQMNGPTVPIGSHGEDTQRLENLLQLGELLEKLARHMYSISCYSYRQEASVKKLVEKAESILQDLSKWSE